MKLDIKALLILVVLAGAAAFFWLAPGKGLQPVPAVTITTIDGKAIELEKLRGKPYMVVFWATDCPGCVKEIPHLAELYQELGKDGFQILAVAMPHDELPLIKAMREQKNMDYEIAFDQDGSLSKAFGGVMVTPTNFLVSPQGKIVLQQMGEFDPDDMRSRIQAMLKG